MSESFWKRIKKILERQPDSTIMTNDIHDSHNQAREKANEIHDFSTVLTTANIIIDGAASSGTEALRTLAQLADKNDLITDTEAVYGKLLVRENSSATDVGDGIALPHIEDNAVEKLSLMILRLNEPISWGTDQVDVIICLLAPTDDTKFRHVSYLAAIANKLLRKNFIEKLHQATSKEEVLKLFTK